MKHPVGREHRRFNREVARNHRRQIMVGWTHSIGRPGQPDTRIEAVQEMPGWLKGGKQYAGHGNRCMCHYQQQPLWQRKRRLHRRDAESTAQMRRLDKIP